MVVISVIGVVIMVIHHEHKKANACVYIYFGLEATCINLNLILMSKTVYKTCFVVQ